MPSIADLRQQYPDLAGLDDEQTVDAVHQAFYADLPREQVASSLGIKPPPPQKLKRTTGEAFSDTGRSIMSGAAGLVKSAGSLYGLATGDMENAATKLGTDAQQYWEDGQSAALKEKRADRKAVIDASPTMLGKFGQAIYQTIKEPALLGDVVASNVATMVPGMAVGRAVAGVRGAMAMRAAQGVGPVALAQQAAIAQGAGTLGTAAAVGTAALQQGADVSADTYDDSLKKTAAQLALNPDFVAGVQAKMQDGMDEPSAIIATKKELGNSAARAAFLPATAVSLAANAIPGATMLERALVGGAAKNTIKAGGGKFAAMAKAGLGEATQETLEEGGGAFVGNLAKQRYVDPNQDLADSVGENAGLGFVGGLGMGGVAGAFHGQAAGDEIRGKKLEEVGPLTRGVNAGLESTAQRVDSGSLAVVSADQLVAHAQQRLAELDTKANGTKDEKTTDPEGKPVVIPGQQPEILTADEVAERAQLAAMKDDPKALASAMGVELGTPTPAPAAPPVAPPVPVEATALPVPAPAPPAPAPAPTAPTSNEGAREKREADRPAEVKGDILPDDILAMRGGPFLTMPGAMSALGRAGEDTHEIVKVTGGLVVRPKAQETAAPAAAPAPAPTIQATTPAQPKTLGNTISAQPTGTRGTTAADLTGKPTNEQNPQARPAAEAAGKAAAPEASADQASPATAVAGEVASVPAAGSAEVATDGVTTPDEAKDAASELPGVDAAPRTVTVAGEKRVLTTEQAAQWDKLDADFKPKFDSARALYERNKANPLPENPDVGLRSAKGQFDAEQKALGFQLSAERRRIVGAQTAKESAAEAAIAARIRTGDTVETPDGQGTVTNVAFGKVRVDVDGTTATYARSDTKKVQAQPASPGAATKSKETSPVATAPDEIPGGALRSVAPETKQPEAVAPDAQVAAPESEPTAEAPAAKPAKPFNPFANDHAAFEGKTVEQKVNVADTGEVATLRMDAAKTMREFDQREQSLLGLLKCLKKGA